MPIALAYSRGGISSTEQNPAFPTDCEDLSSRTGRYLLFGIGLIASAGACTREVLEPPAQISAKLVGRENGCYFSNQTICEQINRAIEELEHRQGGLRLDGECRLAGQIARGFYNSQAVGVGFYSRTQFERDFPALPREDNTPGRTIGQIITRRVRAGDPDNGSGYVRVNNKIYFDEEVLTEDNVREVVAHETVHVNGVEPPDHSFGVASAVGQWCR